jgi:hypothetical protein
MNPNVAATLAKVPAEADRCIVIYPSNGKTACAWIGISDNEVAKMLYLMADEVVSQRLPAPGKE